MLCRTTYRFTDGVVSLITEDGFKRTDKFAFYRVCKLTDHNEFRKSHFTWDGVDSDVRCMGWRLPEKDEVLVIDATMYGTTHYYVPREKFETIE